jgi:hypothetical protein
MTTTTSVYSGPQPGGAPSGGPLGGAGTPAMPAPRRRRKPALFALAVALIVLGALGAVWAVNQASARVSVVGMRDTVAFGQTVQQRDLVEVQLPDDPALHPVPWSQAASLVGKRAATDLQAGSLITANAVTDQSVPPQGKDMVGVPAKSNQMPGTPLHPRDRVLLVPYSGGSGAGEQSGGAAADSGSGAGSSALSAEVYAVRAADANGVSVVDVLVQDGQGAGLAQRAAAGQIAIVLLPKQ